MPCIFTSCFGGNPFREKRGYDAGDSTLRSRRVLVRNSIEKDDSLIHGKNSSLDAAAYADEKVALRDRESLLDDYDEDAEERSMLISEKHLEAGPEGSLYAQEETVRAQRLMRKSIIFRPRKKPGRGPAGPLAPHNTGDELHRRAEFERKVQKMNINEREDAWAAERERREQWKTDRKNAEKH